MRVAIIGGGASGLATAKALVDVGIKPIIFEAAPSIGGLWSTSNKKMWKSLRTNLSKYTCMFPEQTWPKEVPVFPSAQNVNDYLQSYCDTFVGKELLKFQNQVTNVKRTESGSFEVQWKDETDQVQIGEFDRVVVASGFFSNTVDSNGVDKKSFSRDVIYSHQYQSPEDLQDKHVLVVGGSFSGIEIAAEVAKYAKKVSHIVPHHCYVVPRYLANSLSSRNPSFLPLDLVFYELSKERKEKLIRFRDSQLPDESMEVLFKSDTEVKQTHEYFRALIGQHPKEDVLAELAVDLTAQPLEKPRVVISDEYKAMVNCGAIEIIPGKLQQLTDDHLVVMGPKTDGPLITIPATIDSCIVCTGFVPNLSFLDNSIRTTLQFDPQNTLEPLVLYKELFHPAVPDLFFVGMYRGPYFGIIHQQAHVVAAYIAGKKGFPSPATLQSGLTVAQQIRNQYPLPQFPHSDYVGMAFDLAQELQTLPTEEELTRCPIITPLTFHSSPLFATSTAATTAAATAAESSHPMRQAQVQQEMLQVLTESLQGKQVGKLVAYALEGNTFTFHRELYEKDSQKSNFVDGSVTFKRITKQLPHLWYHETGLFRTAQGGQFEVSQSYIYAWNEELHALEIFFSKVGNPTEIDRPFLTLKFKPTVDGWVAQAKHLCGEDNYVASYCIAFRGMNIQEMKIVFDVLGPHKNYRSTTIFTSTTSPSTSASV